jgi:hypothetical protein
MPLVKSHEIRVLLDCAFGLHGDSFLGGDVTRRAGVNVVRFKVGVLSWLSAFRGVLPAGLKCHAASSLRNVASAAARCACAVALSSAIQF